MNNGEFVVTTVTLEKQFTYTKQDYSLAGNAHYDEEGAELKDFNVGVNKKVDGNDVYVGNAYGWTDGGKVRMNTNNIPLEDSAAVAEALQLLVEALTE